jgi:excinuclease ABC subunit B
MKFKIHSQFKPSGSQPQAISKLTNGVLDGQKHQTLLGVTGSGKTFTIANVIEKIQKPTLIISHNKTLAAQLCQEFRNFFPENAVEYFVSYYDHYQPEAYIASSDTYIEKEADVNEEIERLRHSATAALLSRKDVIIVASVSCIYGLGTPQEYKNAIIDLHINKKISREELILRLTELYYLRSEVLLPGKFRSHGNTIEIMPPDKEEIARIELEDNIIKKIIVFDGLTKKITSEIKNNQQYCVFPAKHFVVASDVIKNASVEIQKDLEVQIKQLKIAGKNLEAERLEQRTKYDLEMLNELGYCSGIENYSRYLTGRNPGEMPYTLLDYFPRSTSSGQADFLMIIDESHVTVPQVRAMYEGDKSRKQTLIDYGFRLPSALDNRPLKFTEFESKVNQVIYTTATPADYELSHSCPNHIPLPKWNMVEECNIIEQIIRPTGLVDPEIVIKPLIDQVGGTINEIKIVVARNERVLITTLTKKMAEDLAGYLIDEKINAKYLHSEVETLDRIRILEDLRRGKIDVLVGVNLLREGLDLPEVSLVCILDADKEGFLRSETSLIQTIGRAARNILGKVILYADNITGSMKRAIDETNRRRDIQIKYNLDNNITPQTIKKNIQSIISTTDEKPVEEFTKFMNLENLPKIIKDKEKELKTLAKNLKFEQAIVLRDEINQLRKIKVIK